MYIFNSLTRQGHALHEQKGSLPQWLERLPDPARTLGPLHLLCLAGSASGLVIAGACMYAIPLDFKSSAMLDTERTWIAGAERQSAT